MDLDRRGSGVESPFSLLWSSRLIFHFTEHLSTLSNKAFSVWVSEARPGLICSYAHHGPLLNELNGLYKSTDENICSYYLYRRYNHSRPIWVLV